jgi:elongation of very long chain fatty acids protein 4
MNPMHCLGLIMAYFVTIFTLMRVMKSRERFELKFFSTLHNIILTSVSLYMFVETYYCAYLDGYKLFGNGIDRTDKGLRMAKVIHIFYCSKVLEFGDTVIMCLKKNFHQITFLHVYHHSSIFAIWWIVCFYAPGGESYFSAGLNSFIHVLMYGYYLWSTYAKKPEEGRRPRWTEPAYYKRYVTSLQMLQFACMFVQSNYDLFFSPKYEYPAWIAWILFYYMLTMLALFGNFYFQTYILGGKKKEVKKDATTRIPAMAADASPSSPKGTPKHSSAANGASNVAAKAPTSTPRAFDKSSTPRVSDKSSTPKVRKTGPKGE